MVFTFNSPENTYLQNTSGGTIATAASKDLVTQWVKALDPWVTPLLDLAMSNDEFSQEVHQWGEGARIQFDTTVDTTIDDAVTSLEVAAGDGVLFQEGAILELYELVDGVVNPATYEQVRVTDITGDTLTIVRGHGGTTPVAHASGQTVNFLGTSEALNSEHSEAPRVRGIRKFNYPQRFNAKLTADKRTQNMPTWEHESNPLLADFSEEMLKQKILLERTMFRGRRQAGVGNTAPSTMGGINYFLTSNVLNMAQAPLSYQDIDDILADVWYSTGDPSKLKIVGSYNTCRILDTTLDAAHRSEYQSNDEYKTTITRFHSRAGVFDIQPTRNVPEGELYLLDFNNIKVRPFKGLNWHVSEKSGADHAVDHDVKAISGDFTLEVLHENSMARIYNFNGDIDEYLPTP